MPTVQASVPSVISTLPGVEEALKKGTVAKVEVKAEGRAAVRTSSAASERISGQRREEFKADLEQNAGLVSALGILKIKPTAAGLDRIAAAAIQNPAPFQNLVATTTTAALTLGESQGANSLAVGAINDFQADGGVRATDMADMAYLMARIVLSSQQTEREQAMDAMKEALAQAKEDLVKVQEERDQFDSGGKVEVDGKMVAPQDLKRRARKGGVKGVQARAQLAKVETKKAYLNGKIDALKDTIAALEKALAAQQTASQAAATELIMMLVQQAIAAAQVGGGTEGANASGGGTQPQT